MKLQDLEAISPSQLLRNDLEQLNGPACPEVKSIYLTHEIVAPLIFKRHDDGAYSYVYRQPVTQDEVALAEEAVAHCPTETIGNDGISVELPPTRSHPLTHKLRTSDESPADALERTLAKTREAGADA